MSVDLSPAQLRVLRATAALLTEQGSASYREIAARCGLASYTTARLHLQACAAAGLVTMPPARQPRGVRLTAPGETAVRALEATS